MCWQTIYKPLVIDVNNLSLEEKEEDEEKENVA